MNLDELEADSAAQQAVESLVTLASDSMDIIAWALSEQLERMANVRRLPCRFVRVANFGQFDKEKLQSLEVVQSQLYILKVLSIAMASRWYHVNRPGSRTSTDSSRPQRTADQRSVNSSYSELPPLDDNCAKYILSVMILYIRQTHTVDPPIMLVDRTTDISFTDFEILSSDSALNVDDMVQIDGGRLRLKTSYSVFSAPEWDIPSHVSSVKYQQTIRSAMKSAHALNTLVAEFTGRVIYHISASNWPIVFDRVRTKLHQFATGDLDRNNKAPDLMDLQLLAHSALNRERLVVVLQGMHLPLPCRPRPTDALHLQSCPGSCSPSRKSTRRLRRSCASQCGTGSRSTLTSSMTPSERVAPWTARPSACSICCTGSRTPPSQTGGRGPASRCSTASRPTGCRQICGSPGPRTAARRRHGRYVFAFYFLVVM